MTCHLDKKSGGHARSLFRKHDGNARPADYWAEHGYDWYAAGSELIWCEAAD
jgi:hypothetical protein